MAIEGDVDNDEEDVASSAEDNSVGSDIDIAGERVRDEKKKMSALEYSQGMRIITVS